MNFRLAGVDDLEALVRVRLDFFREMFPPQPPEDLKILTEALRRYYQEHLGLDFWAVLVENDDGRLAGAAFLCLAECPPSPNMPDGRNAELYNVLTYPQYRGRGLAGEMIRRLIDQAIERKISRVVLSAGEAGQPVYKKLGFTEQAGYVRMYLKLDADRPGRNA